MAHLLHQRVEFALLEETDGFDRFVHHVDGVIHGLDKVLYIAAVERRNETASHRKQHVAGDVVRLMFEGNDEIAVLFDIDAAQQAVQGFGRFDDGFGMFAEQVEETILARHQFAEKAHHANWPSVALLMLWGVIVIKLS
ncbi:UNVERIFIED_ORG: hypothetical protein QE448_000211 [Rhizobium sp. SORGH_AS285]|nr:hypothetical protein [Rhizobium sp. SORGH_AS_0285]